MVEMQVRRVSVVAVAYSLIFIEPKAELPAASARLPKLFDVRVYDVPALFLANRRMKPRKLEAPEGTYSSSSLAL